MSSTVWSSVTHGVKASPIDVECSLSTSLPNITIVGMGNKAIDESKERIRNAFKNSGLELPRKRITINLAPAELPKDGAGLDLPMAIAILVASNQIKPSHLKDTHLIGELALDGKIRRVNGVIGHIRSAKKRGATRVLIPSANAQQGSLISGIQIISVANLEEAYKYLIEHIQITPVDSRSVQTPLQSSVDLSEVQGQILAKRALEIAAAGNHNVLLTGPPGAGKSMLARALPSILPPPSEEEVIEMTLLHSLIGNQSTVLNRPIRSPHHSASPVSIIGGGQIPRPGEVSLAHRGVLFLDELPEFPRSVLETLRQPLEDKTVTIARARDTLNFPADFLLLAAQNPCPCGYKDDPEKECSCVPARLEAYINKLSGPLLDRIDLIVRVERSDTTRLLEESNQEKSINIARRVKIAREAQNKRFNSTLKTNSRMNNKEIRQFAALKTDDKKFLDKAAKRLTLSPRGYMRTLKVARTIADLNQDNDVSLQHISESLQFRRR